MTTERLLREKIKTDSKGKETKSKNQNENCIWKIEEIEWK